MADLSATFGVVLDEWQEMVLKAAMGERPDATWAAKRVGLSVPRQNGKSQLLVARALAGAVLFGERKIVISAHVQDTARESFSKLMEIIEADENASLRARIRPGGIMQALNREAVKFLNGATIQFKARSGSGTRGFSSDCLMLDEAQILSQRAWVSINSTMSAMPNPQVWLLGTPPTPEDDGEVFSSVRSSAMSGKSSAVAWLEWAADPDGDPAEEYTRWSANPVWNTRINHEIVQGEYETYPPERFALDRLGVWADEDADHLAGLNKTAWANGHDAASRITGQLAFGVAMSADKSTVTIASVGQRKDGHHHGEIVAEQRGTTWVAPWLASRVPEHGAVATVIDPASGASSLIPDLERTGVVVDVVTVGELAQASGRLNDLVNAGQFHHLGQAPLDAAVAGSKAHELTRGGWLWRPRGSESIAPLNALTLALAGLDSKVSSDISMNVW